MAKQEADSITLDLFANIAKVGRPKTNPLSREQQLRINKRNQLRRDKSCGLVEQLESLASAKKLSRGELIETILQHYLNIQMNGK